MNPVLTFRRAAAWIADLQFDSPTGLRCGIDEDGIPCGRPAYAEGRTVEGDRVAACPMHDHELVA